MLIRKDITALFDIPAPAGKYHGYSALTPPPEHSMVIDPDRFVRISEGGCVNAGCLRLDPLKTKAERDEQVDRLVAAALKVDVKTYLPEQFFLVTVFQKWRHISEPYNFEIVGPEWEIDSRLERIRHWAQTDDFREAFIYHYSGTRVEPFMWARYTPRYAQWMLRKYLTWRDPHGIVSHSVREWLEAVEDMKGDPVLGATITELQERLIAVAPEEQARCYRCYREIMGMWDSFGSWQWCDVCVLLANNAVYPRIISIHGIMNAGSSYIDTAETKAGRQYYLVTFVLRGDYLSVRHANWPGTTGTIWFTDEMLICNWWLNGAQEPLRYHAVMDGRNIMWSTGGSWTPATPY
eukprot:GEMP01045616.1.p1 GENE.GEMP01045616.1~~GEMP01045616.1.p1  ORF type:complete len:350 (-),score=48.80 GEMP01045616.1:324-1373(-)